MTGRLTVHSHGVRLRFATDSPAARRWFRPLCEPGRVHEPGLTGILHEQLGADSVFFDVGANLGYFTVLGARLCNGPLGSVHAFEVDPASVVRIPRSLALNPRCGTVHVNCAAVADRSGALVSFAPNQAGNASTNVLCEAGESSAVGGFRVPTVTIDDYCAQAGVVPDVIKMDIEGAEALAVAGMRETLRRHRPTLLLEVHPVQLVGFGSDAADVVRAVLRSGYQAERVSGYRVGGGNIEPIGFDELADDRPTMLCLRPSRVVHAVRAAEPESDRVDVAAPS